MSVISASSRWVSLAARATKSPPRLRVHLRVVERLEQAPQPRQRGAQLVRDVGDELRAQLLVGDRLAVVGEEDQGLAGLPDLVRLDGGAVGAAPAGEEAHLEALAGKAREGLVDVPRQAVLAEGLENRHPGDEEGEALQRDGVRLHQSPLAVDPQGDEREVLQHLPAAPLGDGQLGLGPRGPLARPPGLGAGTGHEDECRAGQREDRDRQQDHRDDHAVSVADGQLAARSVATWPNAHRPLGRAVVGQLAHPAPPGRLGRRRGRMIGCPG